MYSGICTCMIEDVVHGMWYASHGRGYLEIVAQLWVWYGIGCGLCGTVWDKMTPELRYQFRCQNIKFPGI